MLETESTYAVAWWQSILMRSPMKDTLGHQSGRYDRRADPDGAMGFAEVLATGMSKGWTHEEADRFGAELTKLLTNPDELVPGYEYAGVTHPPTPVGRVNGLHCDYGPDWVLAEAATRAGMEKRMMDFPWKTHMWIDPGYVGVSHGYGAETEVLYETSDHHQRVLAQRVVGMRRNIERYRKELADPVGAWSHLAGDDKREQRESLVKLTRELLSELEMTLPGLESELEMFLADPHPAVLVPA